MGTGYLFPDGDWADSAGRAGTGQIKNQAAIHLRIEDEVETVERPVAVAEAGLFALALEQPVGTPGEFIHGEPIGGGFGVDS